MITLITTALTQRALDRRQPPPALVRRIATWHAPTRAMLNDLQAIDHTLHTTATHAPATHTPSTLPNPSQREGLFQPPLPLGGAGGGRPPQCSTDPTWWQRRAAPLAWSAIAAVIALAAVGAWFATQPPSNEPSNPPTRIAETPPPPTIDPNNKPSLLDAFALRPPRGFTLPRWPSAAALSVRVPVSDAALAQGVHRLGSELEKPLRQEWSRLVRDVSGVANSLQSAWSIPAQPPTNPAPNQSRHPQPTPHRQA